MTSQPINLTCPSCRSSIPMDDINVATDLALCRVCGQTFAFSELVSSSNQDSLVISTPPSGAWFQELPEAFRAGASTRSWTALFLIPFTCAWAGGSLSGIYGSQIKSGRFELSSSIFGLPFVIGSCVLIAVCAMSVAGKIEVTRNQDRLYIFTGGGGVGWSRGLIWSDYSSAREESSRSRSSWYGQNRVIILEGRRRVSFGTMLSEDRRYFLLNVVRKMLATRPAQRQ